ncbi:pimelyl-ACP methyl ester esterase BioV [Hydrogenimonas sp.]
MIYFSGFSLQNDAEIFSDYLGDFLHNPYVVAGFSCGAIDALEFASSTDRRVDRLILLSPAYFAETDRRFVRAQLFHYRKDPETYLEKFFENASFPSAFDLRPYYRKDNIDRLKMLLTYPWREEKFSLLEKRGVTIETYLGGEDRIVDTAAAHRFFRRHSTSYFFKPFGHLLRR